MLNFMRIACVVPSVRVADVEKNTRDICDWIEKADRAGADLVVFPELSLTGYSCADLFFQDALLIAAKNGLAEVALHTARFPGLAAVVGLPLQIGTRLYNCAAVVAKGEVAGIVPKTHIPNQNEFSEKRWFASGKDLKDTWLTPEELAMAGSEDYWSVPVKANQLFCIGGETVLGVEICEDGMVPQPVCGELATHGAEVIVNLSASNLAAGKTAYRRELVKHHSGACSCVHAYVSAGSTESTADMVFSGHSVIGENGQLLAESKADQLTDYMLISDCDLGRIRAERRKNQNFFGFEDAGGMGWLTRNVFTDAHRGDGALYPVKKNPFVPDAPRDLAERCREVFRIQVAGLKRRLELLNTRAVVGVSGGLDSTLALLVAVEAMRQLGRPAADVHALTMPCFGTTDRTYRNALALMKLLGVSSKEIPVREAVSGHYKDIGQDPAVHNATYENAQARERTQVLMDYAGVVGGIVVGTGDLSELALGWCTYNGDQMSMYGVNADVPKTLIGPMLEILGEEPGFQCAKHVLRDVVATPISPELLPPDEKGGMRQKTEDLVGPYALHDFFLYYVLRFGFRPRKVYALACRAFGEEYAPETVKKWLIVFYKRFFSQQFKRSCMPEGVRVGSVCLNPRGDWRMASDAAGNLWIEEAQSL